MISNSLKEDLDSRKESLLKLLSDFIAFKTVAPPGNNYQEIIDYIEPLLKDLGFSTQKITIPIDVFEANNSNPHLYGDRVNLKADLDVGASETLVIYTHLDVVPPGDKWSSDPFVVDIRDGKAYGRGVSDSKGAVVATIYALQSVMKHDRPKYNLSLLFTTDEEVGGYSGLCYFTDIGLIKGDKMLCMDGFSDDVVIGSNGMIHWEVTVHGMSTHSGSSFLGVNALEKAVPIMQAVLDLKAKVQSRYSTLAASSGLKSLGITKMMAILNMNMINAGIKENIVPNRCVLMGDRRVIPEENMEDAENEIKELVSQFGDGVDLRLHRGYPPMRIDPDHPWVKEVSMAVEAIRGEAPQLSGMQGSLDQAYATYYTHIPTAVFGIGRQLESNIHGPDENISLLDLMNYSKFIAELVTR